jgi:hypothetical protein
MIVFLNSFLRRYKKAGELESRPLKPFEIYRFADKLDILLMIIGSIAGKSIFLSNKILFSVCF